MGTVRIGVDHLPIFIPCKTTLTVWGKTAKLNTNWFYLIELAFDHNLPNCLMENDCYVTQKARRVSVILINTTDQNIWIKQPFLYAKVFETEPHCWQYHTILDRIWEEIATRFQPVRSQETESTISSNTLEVTQKDGQEQKEETPLPAFGHQPETTKEYNCDEEVMWLPFTFNRGDVEFSKEQWDWLPNLVYDNQQVFTLHDEDFGMATHFPIPSQQWPTLHHHYIGQNLTITRKIRKYLIPGWGRILLDPPKAHMPLR